MLASSPPLSAAVRAAANSTLDTHDYFLFMSDYRLTRAVWREYCLLLFFVVFTDPCASR